MSRTPLNVTYSLSPLLYTSRCSTSDFMSIKHNSSLYQLFAMEALAQSNITWYSIQYSLYLILTVTTNRWIFQGVKLQKTWHSKWHDFADNLPLAVASSSMQHIRHMNFRGMLINARCWNRAPLPGCRQCTIQARANPPAIPVTARFTWMCSRTTPATLFFCPLFRHLSCCLNECHHSPNYIMLLLVLSTVFGIELSRHFLVIQFRVYNEGIRWKTFGSVCIGIGTFSCYSIQSTFSEIHLKTSGGIICALNRLFIAL